MTANSKILKATFQDLCVALHYSSQYCKLVSIEIL